MKFPTFRFARRGIALVAALLFTACVQHSTGDDASAVKAGILIFGDSGYNLEYPSEDDLEDLFTAEAYYQHEHQDWLDDKRPEDEFEARPSVVSPVTGKVVTAPGTHAVSEAMRHFCSAIATCDFGVMLGDNIYPRGATLGADGNDDAERFQHVLTEPFGHLVEEPASYVTYVTLGNHDWKTSRAGGFAQIRFLEAADGFYMDGPYYSVKPRVGNGDIEIFVIDTSMLLATTTVHEAELNDDGSEKATDEIEEPDYHTEPLTDEDRNQVAWLDDALRSSTAKWKIVMAHHPIWSSSGSKFEQARVLRRMLLPTLCRYADVYLVGHEHTLEIHTDDCKAALGKETPRPLVEILSGAASKQRPVNTLFMAQQEHKYPEHKTIMAEGLVWGFAYLAIDGDTTDVKLMTVPDDGGSEISVDYEYRFQRRSNMQP